MKRKEARRMHRQESERMEASARNVDNQASDEHSAMGVSAVSALRPPVFMNETFELVMRLFELKDPYTSGHQKRISQLAFLIAGELSLPMQVREGVRVSGAVHDIGKITIPSEILSKPGGLTAGEFELIKEHPQIGSNLFKDLQLPWPIADIILQHHERMNGSGYPFGLSNGDIIIEASILAVADVVDSMTSHRPYRPSHGRQAALNEIRCNRGVLYDEYVVDACVKIMTSNGNGDKK